MNSTRGSQASTGDATPDDLIASGEVAADERLPSEAELGERFRIRRRHQSTSGPPALAARGEAVSAA